MPTLALPPIRIYLLGRFEVARGEKILRAADWSRRKAAALLQRLALEGRLPKDKAIEFLWPETDPASGANNLYRTLHALRQTLDSLSPGTAEAAFSFEDSVLSLSDSAWVDAHEFESLISNLHSPREASNLTSAIELYAGDLLPDDLYADWTTAPRESLRRLHREARLKLAAHFRDARDYTAAISLLTPLAAQDRADELVHRELMRLYALAGRRHEALRQYQACVDALAAELDVPPEPETAALYSQILSGDLAPLPSSARPAWSPPAPAAHEVGQSAHLVGRDAEFETLSTWVKAVWRGQGKTILLTGDTGVGKTLLAAEALCAAASDRMITLFGAAYEQEGQLAYQPFVEAFDRYLAERRLPSEKNPITHFKRLGSGDPQQESWALFNAVATFLTDLARTAPVAFMVDDLHATDEASLRLFHYLARQTREAPVVLLATYRADFASAGPPFSTLLNSLYRERLSETLTLTPLTVEAVARMLTGELGGEAASSLVAAVYDITEGNPFFAGEIIQALLKNELVEEKEDQWHLRAGADVSLPAGLGGLLRERVSRLGPPVETALTAAAVMGREFKFDLLRNVTTLPDGALLDALEAALTSELLEETETGYHFRHPLIRRALYDSLSRARRAYLHGETAEAIEAVYTRRPNGLEPHVEELAFHYDLSNRRDHALEYLIQAGRKAARLFAFEVAVNYYERALALLDALGLPDSERRFRLLEQLGKYYKVLADTPKAVAAFDRALEVGATARVAPTPADEWKPQPHDRARVRRLAAMGLLTAGQLDEAAAHLQKALTELEGGDRDTLEFANVLYNLSQLHWHRNEYQEAFDVAQRSLAIAERLNDSQAIARAFEMLALACHSLGEWQTGIGYEQKREALAGPGLDVTDAFDVHL